MCIRDSDTTGLSLHKRGYRQLTSKAPITETLAAALLKLTPWNKERILIDPFCGSGTFPIEAAMMAANIAPGMNRSFLSEDWKNLISRKYWYNVHDEARDLMNPNIETDIQGYDLDGEIVKAARENAKRAGVEHLIHFQQRDVKDLRHSKKYGFVVTNPPYGERIEERENLPALYETIGKSFAGLDSWSMYLDVYKRQMLSLTGNNASDIYDVCQYILQRIILYESSGKDEKAGVGGKISECGKHRQIPPHHSAFLFKV